MFVEAVYKSLTQEKQPVNGRARVRLASLARARAVVARRPFALAADRGDRRRPPPPTPKAAAPIDLTGYWVSVVTEDWRYRMVTPAKGDYQGVPMTPDAVKVADAWDPAADEAAGKQCKSYGAAAIMRVPGRAAHHLAGRQDAAPRDRRRHADAASSASDRAAGEVRASRPGRATRSRSGKCRARRGAAAAVRRCRRKGGSLKVVTTNLRAGIPAEERRALQRERGGDRVLRSSRRSATAIELLVVTTVVDDPKYLTQPFIVSSQFKKQADAHGWDPTPCSATW